MEWNHDLKLRCIQKIASQEDFITFYYILMKYYMNSYFKNKYVSFLQLYW